MAPRKKAAKKAARKSAKRQSAKLVKRASTRKATKKAAPAPKRKYTRRKIANVVAPEIQVEKDQAINQGPATDGEMDGECAEFHAYPHLVDTFLNAALNKATERGEKSFSSFGDVDAMASDVAARLFQGGVKVSGSIGFKKMSATLDIVKSLSKYVSLEGADVTSSSDLVDAALRLNASDVEFYEKMSKDPE